MAADAGSGQWTQETIAALFALPFPELMFRAQQVHRQHHDPARIEACALLSIKTGGCPEDCAYCSQSARHDGPASRGMPMMTLKEVQQAAREAKAAGARRLCLGAAWRGPKQKHLGAVCAMIRAVKEEGLEACATLGMLDDAQVAQLAAAGLDYYNHNIDTSPEHYPTIVSTHTFEDRLRTIEKVAQAGMHVCCGGILGMGESRDDRISFIAALANLPKPPSSVPINMLEPMTGTPLADAPSIEPLELVRTIAACRIVLPTARIRLSAGRRRMTDELQALCFLAGANSVFLGEKLLTCGNATPDRDAALMQKLGMQLEPNANAQKA